MKTTHVTKDGEVILIASMTDRHLTNYLNLCFRKLRTIKKSSVQINPYQSGLMGFKSADPHSVGRFIATKLSELSPYLIEAYVRNLPEIREQLIELVERDAAIDGVLPLNELPSGEISLDDEEDDDHNEDDEEWHKETPKEKPKEQQNNDWDNCGMNDWGPEKGGDPRDFYETIDCLDRQ